MRKDGHRLTISESVKKRLPLAAACFIIAAAVYFFRPGKDVTMNIPQGSTASWAASELKKEGVIWCPTWFKIALKLTGTGKKIRPGEYTLRKNMPLPALLWKLVKVGGRSYMKIVVPEGWRMEQIAERLDANGITDKKAFLDIASNDNLEGYLFPATYYLERNMKASRVIEMMKEEFAQRIKPLFKSFPPVDLSQKEVIILASIVEREAVVVTERPLIAAVYLNRLKKRMPLEADPTVQYALGYWKKNLTYEDLKLKSPYNTYVNRGIPPGPICNPGYESVRAVLCPAQIDALYFVADRKGNGQHVFNISYEEHTKATHRAKIELRKRK